MGLPSIEHQCAAGGRVVNGLVNGEVVAGSCGFLEVQAVACRVSPRAATTLSISARVLMKGGASWMVSPP